MAPPRSLPELIEDTAAEVLLRVPADEPAHLVRASLVCKLWRRILLNPAFLRRYREFHRIPPLLGFLRNSITAGLFQSFRFVPTTSASPMSQPPPFDGARWRALSCRHGRVLLDTGLYGVDLVVWDPITGDLQRLPKSSIPISFFISAAVLCPAGSCSCNHLDCHGGPFLVVSVSSLDGCAKLGEKILKFDLGNNSLSMMNPPDLYNCDVLLMPTEEGSLGLAAIRGSRLYLWSREVDPKGDAGWVPRRVIKIQKLFPNNNPRYRRSVIGFADGVGAIFVKTDVGIFMMELKSGRKRKARKIAPGEFAVEHKLQVLHEKETGKKCITDEMHEKF
ncbi:uncharacterized protein LOC8072785 [Sorghum bicolor]|uniref:uncharacterized protein LOC8072785 n=1 Tax=Sorghum bicolor TaxID=4558 RepID=UPI000B425626|nr:uncharacterized protein LOC8072785 [Sorghum bicolor]|eukprot:XP_021317605.1 uncharacterized protein LOC8072785 [Sorghum bicolor]